MPLSLTNYLLSAHRPRRAAFALTVFSLVAIAAAGCGQKDQPAADSSTAPSAASPNAAASPAAGGSGKKLRLAFVTNNASQYWTIAKAGVEKAKGELTNVDVDYEVPAEGTAADQKRVVDDLLAKGVDGVAISPVDPTNQTEMLNGIAKQALLITQDSDAPLTNRTSYIGTDNVAAGKQEGGLIKEALPNGGKIMLFVGKKDAQNAMERIKGITDALAGSNVQIIDTRTDDADHGKAKSNAADTLIKYPEVAGLVGIWSYNGPAILSAVKDASKIGKVKIICFDDEDDTLAGIKSGAIYATVVQQPFVFGHDSIVDMAKYLNGDKTIFPADKKNIIPTRAIKQADEDAYKKQLDTLIGKKAKA